MSFEKPGQVILRTLLLLCLSSGPLSAASDLNSLFTSDYERFWQQWGQMKQAALACDDGKQTGRFFELALHMFRNEEVAEANARVVEDLAVHNTPCLLQGLATLERAGQERFMRFFLINTLYRSPLEIRRALTRSWPEGRYPDLRELYRSVSDK